MPKGCLFNVCEQQAHIRSHTRLCRWWGHRFQTPRLLEKQSSSFHCAHRNEAMTSDPRCLSSSLPPAFSHRHVFKALKIPIWDFWLQCPCPNFIAWSLKSHIYHQQTKEMTCPCLHPNTKAISSEAFEKCVAFEPWNKNFHFQCSAVITVYTGSLERRDCFP